MSGISKEDLGAVFAQIETLVKAVCSSVKR